MASKLDPGSVGKPGNATQTVTAENEKLPESDKHLEHVDVATDNLTYDDAEHEPELHLRTWVALAAMWLYNYVIVFALLSPPAVVCHAVLNRSLPCWSTDLLAGVLYWSKP